MAKLYDGPIVDAHHHLWNLAMGRHLWLRPADDGVQALGDLGPIRRDYLVEDYRRDAAGQKVAATVHVEALWDRGRDPVEETRWLETLDKSSGVASRYVAYAGLSEPDAARRIAAQAAFGRVVGLREMLSWHPRDSAKCFAPRPGIMNESGWRDALRGLRAHDLHLELMLYPNQAEELAALASDFPDQQFIVNHCASPVDRDVEGMALWRRGLSTMAARTNIAIKISALAAYDLHPTQESMREVIRRCIDAFGTDRAMFGSDFPVGRLWLDFATTFDGFRAAVADLSDMEQRALFHDNARRFYRLDESVRSSS